jgi:phosphatidylserine decarboxylase
MDPTHEPVIVEEGYPFIAVAAFLALFAAASGFQVLSWLLLLFTAAVAAFFRNPFRTLPTAPKAITSPADGKVLKIEALDTNDMIQGPCRKISIFMSPLNVHVNRLPASGSVTRKTHMPGKFYVASKPKASLENERTEMVLETDEGFTLGMVQIAGRLARRIICYPEAGEHYTRGERFGLIRFGSRVELFLPDALNVTVREGEHVKGGESILGYFP